MSVKLQKGQKVNLSKDYKGLSTVMVGLGWDAIEEKKGLLSIFRSGGSTIDCDAFALLLKNGKLEGKKDIVYYGNLRHFSGAVRHMGDNLTGEGEGDDEQIKIDLLKIPDVYDRIILAVNIFDAYGKSQQFGMIKNAFIRLVDENSGGELCIYNLTDDYTGCTAMLFGEIYRHNGEWKFNAIGQGTKDGSIIDFSKRYI